MIPGREPPVRAVSNFLGGYAPEGNQRTALAAKRGIRPDDLFALLREFGGSIAGALTVRIPGETEPRVPRYDHLDSRQLGRALRHAVEEHDLGVRDDSRSMIPGFRPKLLVARLDGKWMLPRGRAHSTHILKPQLDSRPQAILHEHWAHQIAHRMGLAPYTTQLLRAGGTRYLAVERFDRSVTDGVVTLHHQEDLAQALALSWTDANAKFQDPNAPREAGHATARAIGELLGSIPRGELLAEDWLRQLTFRIAIGDNDSHAKNVALLHHSRTSTVAPLYDAVPNLYQPDRINWDLAFAIDGVFNQRRISVERIIAEERSWGAISASRAERVVGATVAAMTEAVGRVRLPAGSDPNMVEHVGSALENLAAGDELGVRP